MADSEVRLRGARNGSGPPDLGPDSGAPADAARPDASIVAARADADALIHRALADTSVIGFAIFDPEVRYLYANQTLASVSGLPVDAHLGRRIEDLFPEIGAMVAEGIREVFRTGLSRNARDLDVPMTSDAGRLHRWRGTFEPILDVDGKVIAVAATVVDVTGQREAELEREAVVRRAEILSQLSERLARESTIEGIVEVATQLATESVGAARAGVLVFVPGPEGSRIEDRVWRIKPLLAHGYPEPAFGAVQRGEMLTFSSLEAAERDFPAFAQSVRDEDPSLAAFVFAPLMVGGEAVGVIALAFDEERELEPADLRLLRAIADIAAQTVARFRLLESERSAHATLDAVLQQMPVPVTVAYADGRRVRNRAAYELWGATGMTEEELTSRLSEANRDEPYEAWPFNESLRDGVVVIDRELVVYRPDGRRIVTSHSSAPVRDASGKITASVVVIQDITQRRESEEARKAFIGVLSHELRTPITSIYAGAKLLQRRPDRLDPETRADLIEDVSAEAERLQRIVEDLLVLSRVERGVELEASEPILIQHAISNLVAKHAGSWPGITIDVTTDPDLPAVRGESTYLEQVLRNLIGNAAKYAGGRVEVTAHEVPEGVQVSVLDSGPGFVEEEKGQLFDLFYRAKRAEKRAPGAGIGLFVVRQLVTAMGGRVWAENRPSGGAAFHFVLPPFEIDADDEDW